MLNAKEIRTRIKSIQDTRKITNAMYMIASSKMRKAKAELDKTRPYFNALNNEIGQILQAVEGVDSPYFTSKATSDTRDETRSEGHTSELQSRPHLVCRLLLEKKKKKKK